ncbi:MAG: hypothetical protein AAF725_07810 [Acidobacteriota bacterium]
MTRFTRIRSSLRTGLSDQRRPTRASSVALAAGLVGLCVLSALPVFGGRQLVNRAIVSNDTDSDNISEVITPVRVETDLGLVASVDPNPASGALLTFSFMVENFGPSESSFFTVELRFPDEVNFASSPNEQCGPDSNGAICGFRNLPPATSVAFEVTMTFPGDFRGPIDGLIRVVAADNDPVLPNDQVEFSIPVEPPLFFDDFEDGTTDAWGASSRGPGGG